MMLEIYFLMPFTSTFKIYETFVGKSANRPEVIERWKFAGFNPKTSFA